MRRYRRYKVTEKKTFLWFVAISVGLMSLSSASAQEFLFKIPQQAGFISTHDVAIAPDGSVWVAETGRHRIVKLDSTNLNVQLSIGSFGSSNGQFILPVGIAVDSSGNVYVGDSHNHRIQKFDSNGNFITMWGSPGSGNGQFSFEFFGSIGGWVAVDGNGFVYVSDRFNDRIQKFDSNGVFITKWSVPSCGFSPFIRPAGIAVDSAGKVYIAVKDQNCIQKFDSNGNFITMWGSPGSGNGQFNSPFDVAVDSSGLVYVADRSNNRIQKFDSNGGFITKWGVKGCGDGQLNAPMGVGVDASGNVYVADTSNDRIQKFSGAGVFIAKQGAFQFSRPLGIAADGLGSVYVSDALKNLILKFNSNGSCLALLGPSGSEYGQFSFEFFGSLGGYVAADKNGFVYVSDRFNNRILRFDSNGNFITQWSIQSCGFSSVIRPTGVAVDSVGNVYVTSKDQSCVQKFTSQGAFITMWGSPGTGNGQFGAPFDLAVDKNGFVYVVERNNHRVQKFDSNGNFITKWGSFGVGDGQFNSPLGIGIDPSGYVYVADTGNHRIQMFNSNGSFIAKWGSFGSGNGQFMFPFHVAVDPSSGRVWVADTNNSRLQVFNPPPNTPVGSNVVVDIPPVTVTFSNVTQAGSTSLNVSGTGVPPPSGFKLGNPPTYYELTTTAVFSGSITVCINYSGISYGAESELKLFHLENNVWVDVTTSIDTVNKIICGSVTSLSPFAIFERLQNQPPVANAGADQSVECASHTGSLATLDGSGSTDPDGDKLTYTWRENGAVIAGAGPTSSSTSQVTLGLGSHTIELTVDDGRGGTDTDEVIIKVVDTIAPKITCALTPTTNPANQPATKGKVPAGQNQNPNQPPNAGNRDGFFQVQYTAEDTCDPSPAVTASIWGIAVVNGEKLKYTQALGQATLKLELMGPDNIKHFIYKEDPKLEVTAIDASGNTKTEICMATVPPPAAPPIIPDNFALGQNHPNPFNPETWIPYSLPKDVKVTIRIYNASGNLIRILDLGQKAAGFYTSKDRAAYWDGRNEYGERVSSGLYFYTIQAGGYTATRKMLLLK